MSQNLFKPTYLKQLCIQYGLTPSKRYGQNFLISEWPIGKMIEAADLKSNDTVVEIGPGFGALTFALAEKVSRVIGLEIERKLECYWEEIKDKEINRDKIEIKWGNALNQLSAVSHKLKPKTYKLIANLPYQITSHVLRVLLELENKPEVIVVMVQKEVAEKICAVPRGERQRTLRGKSEAMSLLSVSVQYYGEPKIIAKVSKGNFWPEPAVDSAILCIKTLKHKNIKTPPPQPRHGGAGLKHENSETSRNAPRRVPDSEFFKVVRAGFANKRKQLWRNLAVGLKLPVEKIKAVILAAAGNEKARAEELSVAEWIEISKQIADNR